jgi:uncharacterized protein YndB with AHSA1/START domain
MRFVNTVTIDCPPAEVFAYLSRFENVPRWNYAISETRKVTDGPVGVGTRYHQTRTLPRPADETFEVTEFDPDRRLSIRGDLGPFQGEIDYLLEPAGDSTVLANTMDLRPAGPLRLLAPLAAPRVRSAVAANLQELKRRLEHGVG